MTLFRRAFVVGAVLVALLGILSAYRDGYFENDFDRMVAPAVMVSTMLPDGSNSIGSGTVIASILKDGKYETYVLTAHHVVVAGKQADGTWLPIAIYSFTYHDRRRVEGHHVLLAHPVAEQIGGEAGVAELAGMINGLNGFFILRQFIIPADNFDLSPLGNLRNFISIRANKDFLHQTIFARLLNRPLQ